MKTKATLAATALLLAAAPHGSAAIVLTGNFNNGTPTPTLTITQDIVFNITTSSADNLNFVFDNWTTSDGNQNQVAPTPSPQNLAYTRNSVPGNVQVNGLLDNFTVDFDPASANDGWLSLAGVTLASGDTFVVKAGSYTFGSTASFNPLLTNYTFTGEVFLMNASLVRMSNNVAVPEPSALGLGALGSLAFLRRRR